LQLLVTELQQAKLVKRVVCKEELEYHNRSNSFPEYLARVKLMMLPFNNSTKVRLRVLDSLNTSRIQMERLGTDMQQPKENQVQSKVSWMDKISITNI